MINPKPTTEELRFAFRAGSREQALEFLGNAAALLGIKIAVEAMSGPLGRPEVLITFTADATARLDLMLKVARSMGRCPAIVTSLALESDYVGGAW